jgi:addiction module HigA family antidote
MGLLKIAVHPGRILKEEFLDPAAISAGALARHLGLPRTRIERLVNEETGVTVDTAMFLARALGTTPQFWMSLQNNFDVASADAERFESVERLQLSA